MTSALKALAALLLSAAVLPLPGGAPVLAGTPALSDDDTGPSLTLPGGPTIPMPPGVEVFGPDGPLTGPRDRAAPDPDAATAPPPGPGPDAQAPAPALSAEERRKARIDDLFKRLAGARDETEANALVTMLERIWLRSGSDTADLLMTRALTAVAAKNFDVADALLDKVVALQPTWAEGWNQRATVHYLEDQDVQSMADLGQVLALEPRHFGALSGMGFILHRNGDDKAALQVLRRAAEINPRNADLNSLIEQLTPEVEGHDL